MNVRPISASFTAQTYNRCRPKPSMTTPAFTGEDHKLRNSLAALAAGSAVMLSSCDKEDCDHPNHRPVPPYEPPIDTPDDSAYVQTMYETPALKINSYKVSENDTTELGTVSLSSAVIPVQNYQKERAEFKTMQKMIDVLGLTSTPVSKEYTSKAFSYDGIPAQFVWMNEKNGSVHQLLFDGSRNNAEGLVFGLLEAGKDDIPKDVLIKDLGSNRLAVKVLSKNSAGDYEEMISDSMYEINGNDVIQYYKTGTDKYKEKYIYTQSDDTSILRTDTDTGEAVKLAEFNIRTIVPNN